MSSRTVRAQTEIYQLCDFLLPRYSPISRCPFRLQRALNSSRRFTSATRTQAKNPRRSNRHSPQEDTLGPAVQGQWLPARNLTEDGMEKCWHEVKSACNNLLSRSDRATSEQETLFALTSCNTFAELLVFDQTLPSAEKHSGATSALLHLDESSSAKKIPTHKLPVSFQHMVNKLSEIAFLVVKYPPVFITPKVLDIYTTIQTHLGKPQTLPEVFHLYANKPLPKADTSPIRYSNQNSNKVSNAIPVKIADRALQSAIDTKQLVVAMDIIESAYTAKAFHRDKFLRKLLIPATGVALLPVAAYTAASQLAVLQTTMDTTMATNVAFTGIVAYFFFTGTIGVVAVTTANDQMERVTWAPGIPLRERWIREEERAALDRIAVSWGFREIWRRGEEEGEEWHFLKEHIGGKGMILDRVELMEGME